MLVTVETVLNIKGMDLSEKHSPVHQSLNTLGVSVYHLEHIFLQLPPFQKKKGKYCNCLLESTTRLFGCPAALSRSSRIYEIENLQGPPGIIRNAGADAVCPLDGKEGAAYVHCLQGEDHVGPATHMLSYCWAYTIGDIIDTLTDFCRTNKLDPKRTYIWICCLCVNQHRVTAQSTQKKSGMLAADEKVDFFTIFAERVKRIGHVLAMMAPWSEPVYLTRAWCIYELFIAHANGCKIDIVMPPKEKLSLQRDIITEGGGIDSLYHILGRTQVEEAHSDVEMDRLEILRTIESTVGYGVLNNQVNNLFRGWIQQVLHEIFAGKENTNDIRYVKFCNRLAIIHFANGAHDAAMEILEAAKTTSETVLGDSLEAATTYSNIGSVCHAKGDYDGAMEMGQRALKIQKNVLGDHPDTSNTYSNIGLVLHDKGDYDSALEMLRKALKIREAVFGDHPDTAHTQSNIGSVLHVKGDFDGAIEMYQKALKIKEAVVGVHPDTAAIYHNIGSVLHAKGDYDGALEKYQKALKIQEVMLGDHPATATSYYNIGSALCQKGNNDAGLEMYQKALKIEEAVFGDHPGTARTYTNIGFALAEKQNYDGAMEMYQKELKIREAVFGDHPDTAITYSNIGSVLVEKRDFAGALEMYRKALCIQLAVLGDHPSTAISYNNIAQILLKMGDFNGAKEMHGKALKIEIDCKFKK